ncbi:MAG: NAD(P) transhydrogenase subunit alpha [Pirellulaceae bacterium]|nr:MAG: NAD(P) transhydrogenase subunit alpha [Pirellulaceae bacterium]
MRIGVLKERYPGERRVGIVPANVPKLTRSGIEVLVESGAGQCAGFPDEHYTEKGAQIAQRRDVLESCPLLVRVRAAADAGTGNEQLRAGQIVVGLCDPLGNPQRVARFASQGVTLFALELIPRTTRAQSMDVLSSQATVAGYRAVLLAAVELPKMFPLLMTAAGTVTAAKVFVIGAGVAGLQAIATARRLGAVVHAYDVRPACREQVESLGAKFVELPLETTQAEDKGGYAKALGEEFYQRQRQLMADTVAVSDVVITTALIPGKPSPLLITAEAVRRMSPGSVIVDLAAERGGNCELTKADQRVEENGVIILGPTNLPSEVPHDASIMLGNNITNFLLHLIRDGQPQLDSEDEIIRETMVARDGQIVNPRVKELLQEPASGNGP